MFYMSPQTPVPTDLGINYRYSKAVKEQLIPI